MAFKFAVVSRDGDVFDTFESARPDWSVGDPVYLADNRQFRVTATIRSSPCRSSSTRRCTACSRSSLCRHVGGKGALGSAAGKHRTARCRREDRSADRRLYRSARRDGVPPCRPHARSRAGGGLSCVWRSTWLSSRVGLSPCCLRTSRGRRGSCNSSGMATGPSWMSIGGCSVGPWRRRAAMRSTVVPMSCSPRFVGRGMRLRPRPPAIRRSRPTRGRRVP